MENIDNLFKYSSPCNNVKNKKYIIKENVLSGKSVFKLMEQISWCIKNDVWNFKIIEFSNSSFKSGDVVSVLEIIFYYIAIKKPHTIRFVFKKEIKNIFFNNSLLEKYNNKYLNENFKNDFIKLDTDITRFRVLALRKKYLNNKKSLSQLNTNIKFFLTHILENNDKLISTILKLSGEILSNTFEHSDGDCLVNMHVALHKSSGRGVISLVFISLTDIFIYSTLYNIIKNGNNTQYSGKDIIVKALKFHETKFDDKYELEDFSLISTFQKSVSTRDNSVNTGGTGFSILLKELQKNVFADAYKTYVYSGNRTLHFKKEMMMLDEFGNVGFNESNRYFDDIPNDVILQKEKYYFPGTIFEIDIVI